MRTSKSKPTVIESIQSLIEQVQGLPFGDEDRLDAIQRTTKMLIRRAFGDSNSYLYDYNEIFFVTDSQRHDLDYEDVWRTSKSQLLNVLNTMLAEIELFGTLVVSSSPGPAQLQTTQKIFVVHGHDGEMTQTTARVLEKLELEPVVIEDEANGGRTVIEKLDRFSDVSFAVILLSPDDMAFAKNSSSQQARPRARQNVVHELGYFTGKLGRKNVLVLFRREENFEMPSNHSGVLYVPYDELGRWRFALARELRECGYSINANKLL